MAKLSFFASALLIAGSSGAYLGRSTCCHHSSDVDGLTLAPRTAAASDDTAGDEETTESTSDMASAPHTTTITTTNIETSVITIAASTSSAQATPTFMAAGTVGVPSTTTTVYVTATATSTPGDTLSLEEKLKFGAAELKFCAIELRQVKAYSESLEKELASLRKRSVGNACAFGKNCLAKRDEDPAISTTTTYLHTITVDAGPAEVTETVFVGGPAAVTETVPSSTTTIFTSATPDSSVAEATSMNDPETTMTPVPAASSTVTSSVEEATSANSAEATTTPAAAPTITYNIDTTEMVTEAVDFSTSAPAPAAPTSTTPAPADSSPTTTPAPGTPPTTTPVPSHDANHATAEIIVKIIVDNTVDNSVDDIVEVTTGTTVTSYVDAPGIVTMFVDPMELGTAASATSTPFDPAGPRPTTIAAFADPSPATLSRADPSSPRDFWSTFSTSIITATPL